MVNVLLLYSITPFYLTGTLGSFDFHLLMQTHTSMVEDTMAGGARNRTTAPTMPTIVPSEPQD